MRVLKLLPALTLMIALQPGALAQSLSESTVSGGGASATKAAMPEQVITINIALKDGQFYLGEIPSRITGERVEAIEQETLLKLATPLLKDAMMQTVRKLPVQAGFVRLKDLKEAGLPFEFDIGQMTLSFFPTADQRPSAHISLSRNSEDDPSEGQVAPKASLSGYVNLSGSVQYTEATGPSQRAALSPALGASAAVRFLDLVIENEATFAGEGKLTRQGTRAVYDDLSSAIRYTAGDITPATQGIQTTGGFLGISVQKSYEKLQPQKNIRPTGQRSFRLERPSEVAIVVNGQVVRRLQMPPGDHDISELPLRAGENMLTLEITDDTGHRETLKFTVFYDHALLAPGVSEWGLAAGYRSTMTTGGIAYSWRDPAVTGYYQRGITEDLTATVHAQSNVASSVAGVMAVTPSHVGRVSVEADGSVTADGLTGLALSMFYTPDTLFKSWNLPGVAQLAGQYKSSGFTPLFAANGSQGELFSLNGFYSVTLPDDFTVAVSGTFSAGPDFSEPKLGAGITLSKSIQPNWNGSVTVSYDSASAASQSLSPGGWNVLGRISWKPERDSEVSFTQDGWHGKSTLGVMSEGASGDGHYAVKADIQRDLTQGTGEDQADLSATYSGPRFDLSATRNRQLLESGGTLSSDVSMVSGTTAIAFADQHVAIGRSIADSFAIVTAQTPADTTTLRVPGEAFARARADSLGPALVSDLPSYTRSQFPIEVDDPPAGYDLGTGIFDVRPSYKSGYALTVGPGRGVTAMGNLETDGKPLALTSGLAKEQGVSNPGKSVVFTNRAGRFCAEGLKPGEWFVEMLSETPVCYRLSIPDNAAGIFDAGTLKPGCPK